MGDLGMVFQKYALFPWKTVMGNVEMSQKLKGVDKKVRQEKAQEYINLVGLKGFENSLGALGILMQQKAMPADKNKR